MVPEVIYITWITLKISDSFIYSFIDYADALWQEALQCCDPSGNPSVCPMPLVEKGAF